ncbi:hypothetical protein [Fluviispira multicolorata]|uniref:GHMP kinase N-terminal domain-containing protein n=1 Tax=Fluviispira multicolorata TaxID=2654512 RepID=A0A833JD06_9BACT|nr:hypothetical protein [Fluviispira multicolorata]KAB8031008.1 hypothetical protein GCL57_08555 [Fluviispira multicolorata]
MKYSAKAPGTCGELVQGYLNGKDFLINSPIPFFAKASLTIKNSKHQIKVVESNKYLKVNQILKKLLLHLKVEENISLEVDIDSKIPRGKGLASSTAELTAVVLAASSALNKEISDQEISNLLLSVDKSSDGVFLPGISHINHLKGDIYRRYKDIPSLSFIIIDSGGEVSTQEFDRDFARSIAIEHKYSIRRALLWIEEGFLNQNPKLIAQAATLSARVNQHVLYKAPLETLIDGIREVGGLGVNCAHTGTVLGVMFDHSQTDKQKLLDRVYQLIHPLPIIGIYPLIGGSRIYDEESEKTDSLKLKI